MADMVMLEPSTTNSRHPMPLCVVFHGNDSNPQAHAEYWRPLTKSGWLVALPQSPRAGEQPNEFIWNTPGLAEWDFGEVQNCISMVTQSYNVDLSKLIFAGFSMGGGLALETVLGGHIPALGFVVVAPYVPYKFVDPRSKYIDLVKTRSKHGYCIVGERDSFATAGVAALAARLPGLGIACVVETHPDLEHAYPPDFEKSLTTAIDFVSA